MNISDIINEEIKRALNEAYTFPDKDKNFFFNEFIENPSFHKFEPFTNDADVDIIESQIWIRWHVGFWLKEDGIEGFFVEIDDVDGTYTVELRHKQSDEVMQENVKNIKEVEWKFIVDDFCLQNSAALGIKNATFDFSTNICTINF